MCYYRRGCDDGYRCDHCGGRYGYYDENGLGRDFVNPDAAETHCNVCGQDFYEARSVQVCKNGHVVKRSELLTAEEDYAWVI